MIIGRLVTSDIVINDDAASRRHAELYFDSITEQITINDLKSSNGTYVNRQRITGFCHLHNGDVIRIGQTLMHLTNLGDPNSPQKDSSSTRAFSRELVLEAIDEHPILLFEITEKLNTVVDVDEAVKVVIDLVKHTLGADECEVVLAERFKQLLDENADGLTVRSIRNSSVEVTPLAVCVPLMSDGKPLGLIRMERTRAGARPFDKRDVQMAIAISHQTSLALERIDLLEKVRQESQIKQLLLRFVSPIEAEEVLKDYLRSGNLPELTEKMVTVLFAEIADTIGLAKRIGPKRFSLFINAFYQYATQVVFKYGGMVKYLGDGLLAVFMESQDGLAPEERATVVARDIIEYIKNVDTQDPSQTCAVGVAINSGKAMVGYITSQERAEFNVLGSLIKVTYRMQEYALPNRIFVGATTAEAIRNKYFVQKAGSLTMRGNPAPIQVYEVAIIKTAPFVPTDKDSEMSAAFKSVVDRLKALRK
jgi:class 3 adenylate cyclase